MKRLCRWVFHLLTLLSLLFCLAMGAIWIRSYFAFSELFQARYYKMVDQKTLRYSTYQLYLSKGAFHFVSGWSDYRDKFLIKAMLPTGTSSWQFSPSNV